MSNRQYSALREHEQPLLLSEIIKLFKRQYKPWQIYHVIKKKCTPFGGANRSNDPVARRAAKYFPSDVRKELKSWNAWRPAEAGRVGYVERGTHWIPVKLVKAKCGIDPQTVERMQNIRPPRKERVEGAIQIFKFFPLEDILREMKRYQAPQQDRLPVRKPEEIRKLVDDDLVNLPEAQSVGFSRYYLMHHTLFNPPNPRQFKRRILQTVESPIIERFIHGEWRERISSSDCRVSSPWFRWGDLKEILHRRDNPPVPDGGKLLRDAIPGLKNVGIKIDKHTLMDLITSGTVGGGTLRSFQKNLLEEKRMWWMAWEDRHKIPQYKTPGTRPPVWINGKDYYPAYEATNLACLNQRYKNPHRHTSPMLQSWTPTELGGQGTPCPHLQPPRTLNCIRRDLPHKFGDSIRVFAGDDLREIARAISGHQPTAPKRPRIDRAMPTKEELRLDEHFGAVHAKLDTVVSVATEHRTEFQSHAGKVEQSLRTIKPGRGRPRKLDHEQHVALMEEYRRFKTPDRSEKDWLEHKNLKAYEWLNIRTCRCVRRPK